MILHIAAGGRTRAVDISRNGTRFLVSIDGRRHEVDVREVEGVLSLLVGTRSYEVAVGPQADGATTVHVDGVPVEVSIAPARPSWGGLAKGAAAQGEGGPQRITAPMPGKIVKLLVKPGDVVQARQGLVVVEAMKMENELRAKAPGTVSEVRVTEGSSVEAGAILVLLD